MSGETSALVERAKGGDRAAASELIEGFYERIYAYFRRRCGNEEDAADLTQKAFSKAWSSLPNFTARASFNTWLHSIAHHVYVDWRRVNNRFDAQDEAWWDACIAEGPGPFESAAERESAQRLYRAVEQLPHEQRDVVHLHYYQSLSIQETADALAVATSTVKYRLRNALDVLQTRLSESKLHA